MTRLLFSMETLRKLIWSRWLLIPVGIWIQCTGGSSYNFGLYSQELKTRLQYDQKSLDTVGFFKDIGANVGVISGLLCNCIPAWCVIAIGVLQNSFGYVMMWLAVEGRIPAPALWQMCFYMLLAANGQTFLNTAVVVTCVKTFPLSRGIVIGLMKGFLGLSGAILAQIYHAIYSDRQGSDYLLMVSWLPAVINLPLMLIISPQAAFDYPNEKSILNRFSIVAIALAAYLAAVIILENFMTVTKILSTAGCIIMLLILLIPLGAAIIAELECEQLMLKKSKIEDSKSTVSSKESFQRSAPHEDDSSIQDIHPFIQASQMHGPLLTRASLTVNPYSTSTSKEGHLSEDASSFIAKDGRTGESHTLWQALSSGNFWLLFITTACGMGSGLTAINNISQLGSSLGYSQWNIATFVSLLSIWNFLGRFGAGFISDRFLYSKGIARPTFIAIALGIMCLGHLIIASAQPGALYFGLVVVGICYGSQWSLMPATTSEIFGLQHFGTLFNTIAIASPVGSYLLSVRLAGYIYDQETKKEHGNHLSAQTRVLLSELGDVQGQTCHGAHCFRLTFIIMAVVCLFGCAVATILVMRSRSLYQEVFERMRDHRKERERDV